MSFWLRREESKKVLLCTPELSTDVVYTQTQEKRESECFSENCRWVMFLGGVIMDFDTGENKLWGLVGFFRCDYVWKRWFIKPCGSGTEENSICSKICEMDKVFFNLACSLLQSFFFMTGFMLVYLIIQKFCDKFCWICIYQHNNNNSCILKCYILLVVFMCCSTLKNLNMSNFFFTKILVLFVVH